MKAARVIYTASLVAAALLVAACGSSSSSSGNASSAGSGGSAKHYTVVISNNFLANPWRVQMENLAKVVATNPRFNGQITLKIENAAPTVTAQIQSLNNIILQKPSAILVDAGSPTALNPSIQRACAEGILVFSYDQTVTAPCAKKLLIEDYGAIAHDMAMWMGTELKGKGNILLDRGLPGASFSTAIVSEVQSTLAKNFPNVKVVGTYVSMIAPGPEQSALSSLLASNPNVDGIISQGWCSAQLNALKAAKRPPIPGTCLGVNGNAQAAEAAKQPAFMFGAPAWVGGLAVQDVYNALQNGTKFPDQQLVWKTNFVSSAGNVSFPHQEGVALLKAGSTYFPAEPASLVIPPSFGSYNLTPQQALTGH